MSGRVVIAAGGTGGHMFPAQALAEKLLAEGWQVTLSTDARGARYTQGFPPKVQIEEVNAGTTTGRNLVGKLLAPFRLAAGVIAARRAFAQDRPDIVVGFGGYPSFPALAAAALMGLPRMIHEQNGVLGRVNQLFAKRVDAIACGTSPTTLPEGVTGAHTGNPVRGAVLERAGAPYIPPGDYPMSLLVIGGSQGARILSDVVPPAIAALPPAILSDLRVSHQARSEDGARVQAFYAEHQIDADVQPFFSDVPERMAEAQLVISRAGASSIADIAVIGRPSILIPLAIAARDEQTANARGLTQAEAAIMVPEAALSVDSLARQIETILTNPKGATKMAHNALAFGRPDATEALYALVAQTARSPG